MARTKRAVHGPLPHGPDKAPTREPSIEDERRRSARQLKTYAAAVDLRRDDLHVGMADAQGDDPAPAADDE
jgi:hypothetical protein